MFNPFRYVEELKEIFGEEAAIKLLKVFSDLYENLVQMVSKEEFNELKEIVGDLGKSVEELAEAQKRTEMRVEELAEAQKRTEMRVEELAEAQKRTEEEIARLVHRMDTFEDRLEGISNSIGYGLEDASYKALPKLLAERYGLKIESPLVRRYFSLGRKEIQIDIYGRAKKNGKPLLLLGECKVRPSKREVERFERYARRIGELERTEIFLLFVAYDFPPKIEHLLQDKGIAYFWSYELR